MPIRPENKNRYPKDWKAIRARILERAGNKCEFCGAENGSFRKRTISDKELGQIVDRVKIVLTVAHLDHMPENVSDENLKALCQRCHNRYDAKNRANGRRQRRHKQLASGELAL